MSNSHLNIDYIRKYSIGDTFVETGTYKGDSIRVALEFGFKQIHSIEINEELYESAKNIFKENSTVKIWNGDSIDCLDSILKEIKDPVTFWLDAHASGPLSGGKSGGSPVIDELSIIKKYGVQNNTIFIDDRRLFGSYEWSGVKESDAIELIKNINPNYNIYFLDGHIEKDVICATVL